VNAPRVEIDLGKIEHNTRVLVDRLAPVGIGVTGVTKATLGDPAVGAAMLRGGVLGLGDSRVANLDRLARSEGSFDTTLIRTPMLSQVRDVVRVASCSLNTERPILEALDRAAQAARCIHQVVLMVELGDLREGIAVDDVSAAVGVVRGLPALRLTGLGANLACQNGVVPTDQNMHVLSDLVSRIESTHGVTLTRVSGGNSANLQWVDGTSDVGRINDLRLGEAILLGLDPLHRRPIQGLHLDAFTLSAEVIEVADKPSRPWGERAQAAFGTPPKRRGTRTLRQAIVALGRQDIDPTGLFPPLGIAILGTSSDHLMLDVSDHAVAVGDEIEFGIGYSALVAAMTSPFVAKSPRLGDPAAPPLLEQS
jgi:predicted amino acid racemase